MSLTKKQGGHQVGPKPGSERIWKGVWGGGGWWETSRAAGANQPAMTKNVKNSHSEVSLLPSSTSEALGFPTCLFPFILQALHIPTEAKQWLNTTPTLLPMRQTYRLFFTGLSKKWKSTDSVILKKLIWDKGKLQMDFQTFFREAMKKGPCSCRW